MASSKDPTEKSRGRGRPPWAPHGEPTKVIRLPVSQIPVIQGYLNTLKSTRHNDEGNVGETMAPSELLPARELPFVQSPMPQAGMPMPVGDLVEETADLNQMMVKNPAQSFLVRVRGESMVDARVHDGDILIVDRSIEARKGKIVLATWDHNLYVKRYGFVDGVPALLSENEEHAERYPPLMLSDEVEHRIWGCITGGLWQA